VESRFRCRRRRQGALCARRYAKDSRAGAPYRIDQQRALNIAANFTALVGFEGRDPTSAVELRRSWMPASWNLRRQVSAPTVRKSRHSWSVVWVAVRVGGGLLVMILGGCYRNPMGYRPRSRKSQAIRHRDRVVLRKLTPHQPQIIPFVVIGTREPREQNVHLTVDKGFQLGGQPRSTQLHG
jgi:hypothetical protein